MSVAPLLFLASLLAPPLSNAAESQLSIVLAGVQRSEDAPFVASNFRFLPGDFVYVQFQIVGYGIETLNNTDVRKMSLTYEISPRDSKDVPLTSSIAGDIKNDLSAEDKNWSPKRRSSFLLPSFIAAGEFHLHLIVKDLIGNTSEARDIPFHVGGVVVPPSAALTLQDFQFFRNEDDNAPLEVPAFRAGDTVYARFNMTGFRLAPENKYELTYGLMVLRPGGKSYLNQPTAAQLSNSSFYPAQFVPGGIALTTTREAAHGQYLMTVTIHDVVGSQTYQLTRPFTIE